MIQNEAVLFLTSIESIGYKTIDKIWNYFGGIDNLLEKKDEEILSLDFINEKQKKHYIKAKKEWNLNKYLKYLKDNKIKLITRFDREYPKKLLNIPDPPFQLFYIGELPDENKASVAIIGARNCSSYGIDAAKYFSSNLAVNGIQVISGLASGIDGIAQKEAVDSLGKSYGILGCGVDKIYPASNKILYEKLKINGGLISEFPPGSSPVASHFPMRNRIISGLADIVLVIEAKERSGTSITVKMALEQGREIFAVPGRINDALSIGCNKLISEGAGVARNYTDILDALNITGKNYIYNDKKKYIYSQLQNKIIKNLEKNPCNTDELWCYLKVPIEEILSACTELYMDGIIEYDNGKYQIKKIFDF